MRKAAQKEADWVEKEWAKWILLGNDPLLESWCDLMGKVLVNPLVEAINRGALQWELCT